MIAIGLAILGSLFLVFTLGYAQGNAHGFHEGLTKWAEDNKTKKMCARAQSESPCPFSLECGHGEPHVHNPTCGSCMETNSKCVIVKESC